MRYWWSDNWPLVLFGVCAVLAAVALVAIARGEKACYERGLEHKATYFGGETMCVETTNGTRRVITIQR